MTSNSNPVRVAMMLMYPGAINTFSLEEAKDRIKKTVLGDCHAHDTFDVKQIEDVLSSYCDDGKEYADSESAFLLLLKDGNYAVAWEDSDSSGHG